MDIVELKQAVSDGTLGSDFLVLVCDGNQFLANQYINELCRTTARAKNVISSIYSLNTALSLVMDYSETVNVVKTDVFEEKAEDYSEFENIIVICNKVDKKIEKAVSKYMVKMPKLVDWQIKSYIKFCCPGLSDPAVDWLYNLIGNDLYRLQVELDKIKIFKPEDQEQVFSELANDQFVDMFRANIFNLKNELVSGKLNELPQFMTFRETSGIAALQLTSILLNEFKKALFISQNSGLTAADLEGLFGITSKQYYAIKKAYQYFPAWKLQENIELLSNIDLRLRTGRLDMTGLPKTFLLDYIMFKVV